MSMESYQEMLSELDSFCCDFSFIRDLDETPMDDIMMPMMDDLELESIFKEILDMKEDITLQQVPTNNNLVQHDVIDLSMDDEPDEDEMPLFYWDTSCCDLSFNDHNMNDVTTTNVTTIRRDTIQLMLDSEQYNFKRIDMNDVQKDGITNKQRDTVAEWMFQVMDFYGANKQYAVLAMSYMDRFLQQHSVHKTDIALVSACSILIAVKQNTELDNNHGIATILNIMAPPGGFQKQKVDSMELRIILESTDCMLSPSTPFDFGREFVNMLIKGESETIPHQATICQLLDHVKFLCELAACDYRFTLYRPSRVAIGAILVALNHKIHTNISGKQRRKLRVQIEEKMGVTITRENGYDSDIQMCETNLAMAFEKFSSTIRTSRHAKIIPKGISSRKDNEADQTRVSEKYIKRPRSEVLSHHAATETPSKKSRAWPVLPLVSPTPLKPTKLI